jgi:acetyl esterase/lipase
VKELGKLLAGGTPAEARAALRELVERVELDFPGRREKPPRLFQGVEARCLAETHPMIRALCCLLLVAVAAGPVLAQAKKDRAKPKPKPARPTPTHADVAYGKHPRQKLDFWQAKSDSPTPLVVLIHGGGWTGGDKSGYGTTAIKPFLDAGISVAAINYRFIKQAMEEKVQPPVKAPLYDAARAIQFHRSTAKDWNLDRTRVGATGGSAGACTSLWLAFHDDLADPRSSDPVARESTRLTAAAVDGAQTSLDPKQVREWMPNATYGGHAFGFRAPKQSRQAEFEKALANRDKILPWIREYSPIEMVTKDDPPVFLAYGGQGKPPVVGEKQKDPTHSAVYGLKLAERCKEVGVECVLVYPGAPKSKYASTTAFLIAKLKGKE